ncbi:hypothetical protein PCANC_15059 [Puccinia coronata f. sp. avenae]|uniref:Uncharacterized protein n=1 Tax=Puccinia coronata f. sp. avenae TaxID=200324 RepID=A0A2N5S807_9BASI|nr:hypothetical protein PCASD_18955 [Puccinia coronata f. sp. avenae]PLW29464.1 hypothetical protein PCASD_16792 [Puccinia coronata f. sp. avenae]PLW34736.1 hypothetical protein PCANC_15059 [Puccinia coronata f. sp. avenae]
MASQKLIKRAALVSQAYPDFQISDGSSGDCANRAAEKFLAPYKLDQASLIGPSPNFGVPIDKTDVKVCKRMAKLASDAESDFNAAISKAGGVNTALGRQLQNGKVCNKVLKLTGKVLLLQVGLLKQTKENFKDSPMLL